MPIKIPDQLPSKSILESESIFVMTEYRAIHQDIRPLRLLILNLMPTKIVTETQLLRKLSNSPLQVEVEFLQTISYTSKNTDPEHLSSFYTTFENVKNQHYDGMIITGAPVENLEFEEVDYWDELCNIMEWSTSNVHSTFHICWGAQAGLFYHYGVNKHPLPQKISGVYSHTVLKPQSHLFRGFDDVFYMPHSRYTCVLESEISAVPDLELLSVSEEAGVFAVKSTDNRRVFITGHPEYDGETLALEYFRDVEKGLPINVPENYFPGNDPTAVPPVYWRAHAQLMYSNWLNYYVYQSTPYDISQVGISSTDF
ncbi:MAG: homoserine O-succinyltransferase [Oscillospiraceae bacterium]|nr:homoserine O-succinyltransferase [Oscillospiraceae bacterium]